MPQAGPAVDAPGRVVRERPADGAVPLYRHPEWVERFPWLVQGTTARDGDGGFDLGLFGANPAGAALARWRALREGTGCRRAVYSRQVHEADVVAHEGGPPGLFIGEAADGHCTRAPGVLLAVSVADCVPLFLVDPERRAIAALHGGWRGVAAGILEAGIAALRRLAGSEPSAVHAHFGPAICGECYEVGPEVHAALGLEPPAAPTPVDLRAVLARRARALELPDAQITRSAFCTRCGDSPFFSHRGGDAGRQMGVLGITA